MSQYPPPPPPPPPGQYPPPDFNQQFYIEKPPSRWPKVIGIISIILGGLGLLSSIGGLVMLLVAQDIFPAFQQQTATPEGLRMWQIISYVVSLVLSTTLLIAGIMTAGRRQAGRPLHMVYALLTVVMAIANLIVTLPYMSEMVAASTQGRPMNPQAQAIAHTAMQIGVVGGFVMALAYPVFLLIWFNRKVIKAEVKSWASGAARP